MGAATVQLHTRLPAAYLRVQGPSPLKGWHERWFYIHNPAGDPLPCFTGAAPLKNDAWKWGCSHKFRSVIDEVVAAIGARVREGLTGAGLVRTFLEHQVQPLKKRDHPLHRFLEKDDPTPLGAW